MYMYVRERHCLRMGHVLLSLAINWLSTKLWLVSPPLLVIDND